MNVSVNVVPICSVQIKQEGKDAKWNGSMRWQVDALYVLHGVAGDAADGHVGAAFVAGRHI